MQDFQFLCCLVLLIAFTTAIHGDGINYSLTTFAGRTIQKLDIGAKFGDGYTSNMSCQVYVHDMLQTQDGSIYLVDKSMAVIRKIDGKTGIINLIAGNYLQLQTTETTTTQSSYLFQPTVMTLTKNESIMYIAGITACVKKIDFTTGYISVVNGTCSMTSVLGLALSDDDKYLFISNYGQSLLMQLNISSGIVETIYGDGASTTVNPQGIVVIGDLLYLAEGINSRISLFNWRNKTKLSAFFKSEFYPTNMFKRGSHLYVCDRNPENPSVKKINLFDPSQNETISFPGVSPNSFLIDLYGNMIVADKEKYIYNYTTEGERKTIAGDCNTRYFSGFTNSNSHALSTDLYLGVGRLTSSNGILYGLGPLFLNFMFKFENGYASIVAGDGRIDDYARYSIGSVALNSSLGTSPSVIAEYKGDIYYSSLRAIIKIDKNSGRYVLVAGTTNDTITVSSGDGGSAHNALFDSISDLLIDGDSLYIADSSAQTIRRIDLQTNIIDLYMSTAPDSYPSRLAIDPTDGCLVFSESLKCTIRKIQNGSLVLLAGNGTCADWDFTLSSVPATSPMRTTSIAYLSNGDLIVADMTRYSVRKLAKSTNSLQVIAGTPGTSGYNSSLLGSIGSIIVNTTDNSIYVAETSNYVIRKLIPYCRGAYTLSANGLECIAPSISVKFDTTITYLNSVAKIAITYPSNVKSYFSSFTYKVSTISISTGLTTSLVSGTIISNRIPVIISIPTYSIGTFTGLVSITVGNTEYKYSTLNSLSVMNHEEVVKESFLESLSTAEVATIASNSDTYTKSTDKVSALTLVTVALSSAERNSSDLDQTLKVSQALNVISSQTAVTDSIVTKISDLVSDLSTGLSSLSTSALQESTTIDTTVSQVLNAYSNIISFKNNSATSSSVLENMILVSSKSSSEKDSTFQSETNSFTVSVVRNINSTYLKDNDTLISTPNDLIKEGVSAASVTFLNVEKVSNLYNSSLTKLTSNLAPSFVSKLSDSTSVNVAKLVDLKYVYNGGFLKVSDLVNPIMLKFNVDPSLLSTIQSNSSLKITCKYFNETKSEWLSNGCITQLETNGSAVLCICNHTTTFSSFVEVVVSASNLGEIIASIVIGCFLIVLCLIAFIGVISTSKSTPTKSRGVIPYMALSSLLIELIFTFIITNALAISNNANTNIVKQVAIMISSSFYCLAILNYLILNVRYIIFRYVYEIMAILDEKKVDLTSEKKFKWIKIIFTSNTFSLLLNLVVAILFIAFYVIFISLRQTRAITSTEFSSIMAGSVFSFVLFMSAIIVVIHLFDMYMESKYVQMNSKLSISFKKNALLNPVKCYFMNDNLAFRKEFVFFAISIVFFIISYGVGFSTLNSTSSGLHPVELTFGLLYNIMLIMSFGGLVSIVSIMEFVFKKRRVQNSEIDEDSQVKDILTNTVLAQAFKQFAKTEHSLENVIFWDKLYPILESINNGIIPENGELCKHFQEWKENFLDANSPMEVNFSHQTKKSFFKVYDSLIENERNENEIKEILKDVYCALMMNLDDTFSRFSLSESFEKMNKLMELKENMGSTLKLKE